MDAQQNRTTFSYLDRPEITKRMQNEIFDLVIIGGGINGVGVARDAASRGMKVAVIEKQDFAQGTSSRSSKLIHGGIRYLENLEFHLVFEALSERRLLFEIAPHLVHPLRFVLPLYKGGRVGMFKMGLGMWLYDALSMFEAPELHERLNAKESIERLPLLQTQDLLGSYVYSDAYMDDDRLVHETLRAAVDLGAEALNFVSADEAEMKDGKVVSIGCHDHLTHQRFRIRGRHFVSTVGPWTDTVATQLLHQWKPIMRPSKGVHLTFDRKRLQLNQAVVMAADNDKRIVFGIPRHEMIIIGTTDTDYKEDPTKVTATAEDVKYLLGVAGEYFPGAKLTASDIVATYAGVRPLVADGSESESKTSREHDIINDPRNVTFVAGGKYTTYRLIAEQTVASTLKYFSLEEQIKFRQSETKRPLNPNATEAKMDEARRFTNEWSETFDFTPQQIEILIDRHAYEALHLLQDGNAAPYSLGQTDDERIWGVEARHAIRKTMCCRLVDFYTRRAPLFLARADHGLPLIANLSRIFQAELGWSDSRRQEEATLVQAHVRHELAWKQAFGITSSSV